MDRTELPRIHIRDDHVIVDDPLEWMEHGSDQRREWLLDRKKEFLAFHSIHSKDLKRIEAAVEKNYEGLSDYIPKCCGANYLRRVYGPEREDWGIALTSSARERGRIIIGDEMFFKTGSTAMIMDFFASPDGRHVLVQIRHDGLNAPEIVLATVPSANEETQILWRMTCADLTSVTWLSTELFAFSVSRQAEPIFSIVSLQGKQQDISLPDIAEYSCNYLETSLDLSKLMVMSFDPQDRTYRLLVCANDGRFAFQRYGGKDLIRPQLTGWSDQAIEFVINKGAVKALLQINCQTLVGRYRLHDPELQLALMGPCGDTLLLRRIGAGRSEAKLLDRNDVLHILDGPQRGSWVGAFADYHHGKACLAKESWDHSPVQYSFDFHSRTFTVLRDAARRLPVKTSDREVTSFDGVGIRVTLIEPENNKKNKASPCLLRGYGGFESGSRMICESWLSPWFEQGGWLQSPMCAAGMIRGSRGMKLAKGQIKSTLSVILLPWRTG